MFSQRRMTATILGGLVCSVGGGLAAAQTSPGPGECVDANTAAQSLVREGKFVAAREQLKRCLEPACPGLVRDDCAQRLDALDRVQPTIVFEVKDGQGRDLAEVTIHVDGQLLTSRLGGTAMPIDPGEHEFSFATAGAQPITQRMIVREGEKGRRERIVLAVDAAPQPEPVSHPVKGLKDDNMPVNAGEKLAPSSMSPPSSTLGTQRTIALGVLGVGLVGVAAGAALALEAKAKADDSNAVCSGNTCSGPALEMNRDARRAGNWATAAFTVGAVGLVGATVLWVTATPSSTHNVQLGLAGGSLRLRGTW